MFETLIPLPDDPLLQLMSQYREDARAAKIDLGVGVYRDATGATPVMNAVKSAERELMMAQTSKSYLGLAGDVDYLNALMELTFSASKFDRARMAAIQTPGGSGALRLAGDVISGLAAASSVHVGLPCWANHIPIFSAAGLPVETYRHLDPQSFELDREDMFEHLSQVPNDSIILLQGCCHNPSGVDLSAKDWVQIAEICAARGAIPLIDIAYNGLGDDLERDMLGVCTLLERVPRAILTVSCSKNFGLYRERTGALFILAENAREANIVRSHMFATARTSYSMPPDHGAAIVKTILTTPELDQQWRDELQSMTFRIKKIRTLLTEALKERDVVLDRLAQEAGMFSLLPLNTPQITRLRDEFGIYMAGSGRINIAGLQENSVIALSDALASVWSDAVR